MSGIRDLFPMPRSNPLFWWLLGAGLVARVVLAFAFYGGLDLTAFEDAQEVLRDRRFDFYEINEPAPVGGGGFLWPYPPLLLAWMAVASSAGDLTGLPFHGLAQLLPIAADLAIALAVYAYLGMRGASERVRLIGLGLVMLGPSFIAISGYMGQIDSVAIAPAVVALIVWERADPSRRALYAGALIGLGGAVKSTPLLLLFALAPLAASPREAVRLVVPALAIPAVTVLPFFIAQPGPVLDIVGYSGRPGLGGLSLVAQPDFAAQWLVFDLPDLGNAFLDNPFESLTGPLILAGLVALVAFLLRFRPPALEAAVLLWLVVYALSANFFPHYMIWGLPFFLMARHFVASAAAMALITPPMVLLFASPYATKAVAGSVYAGCMILLWAGWVVALVLAARTIVRSYAAAGGEPSSSPVAARSPRRTL